MSDEDIKDFGNDYVVQFLLEDEKGKKTTFCNKVTNKEMRIAGEAELTTVCSELDVATRVQFISKADEGKELLWQIKRYY